MWKEHLIMFMTVPECYFDSLVARVAAANRIWWKFSSAAEDWYPQGKQNILPGQMAETLVTNLRPWTVYHLRVFAENQLGKSKDGKVLQVKKGYPFTTYLVKGVWSVKIHFAYILNVSRAKKDLD